MASYPKAGLIVSPAKNTSPGRTCTLSAWILTDGTERFDPFVQVATGDGVRPASNRAFTVAAPPGQPWWTHCQETFTIPPDTAAMVVTIGYGFAAGTIWLDDLSLKLDDGTELVENGTFEK